MTIITNTPEVDPPPVAPWRDADGNEIAHGAYLRCPDGLEVLVTYDRWMRVITDEERWTVTAMILPIQSGGLLRSFLEGDGRGAVVTVRPRVTPEVMAGWFTDGSVDA